MNTAQYRSSERLRAAGFRHAFFTRHGGVSRGPYASLNFSWAVGDDPEDVTENLRRAADALGVERRHLYFLSQVHGRSVREVDGSERPETVLSWEGDAVVSAAPGVACAVRVADCVPILLGDPASGAVAAVHAGWRGLVANVIGATVDALEARGAARPALVAAVGPHIGPKAFEVGPDVASALAEASDLGDAVVDRSRGPRPHVNLRRVARAQLERAGLRADAIDGVPGCTVEDPDLFSYRRDGKRSGRMLAAIVAGKPEPA